MNYLISQYPVTQDYLEQLAELTDGPLEAVVISTITAQGYIAIFQHFRRLDSDILYVPAIDPSMEPLLAPLQILSMLASARRRLIVGPDFSFQEFGIFDILKSSILMTWGIVGGFFEAYRDWRHMGKLLKVPRFLAPWKSHDQIIYLNTNLWLGIQAGGAVAHISGVVKGLLDKGFEVLFSSVETPVALPITEALTFNSVKPRNTYVIPRDLNHYRHNGLFFDALSPLFRKPVSFIYQRMSLGNFSGVMLSRHHRVPLVLEYNGSEQWLAHNWGTPLALEKLARRAENTCLKHAHLVVTVSNILKNELIKRGVEPERIVSYPNGVNTALFDSDRFTKKHIAKLKAQYGISQESLLVTFVGTFGPWHGAEIFAQTIAEMVADDLTWLKKKKLHFMFIGDGARRQVVERLTAVEEVHHFVTLTGLIDQDKTPIHLAASDILVSPHVFNPDGSPFFGSPTKLFEYLAAGRPVIASDLGQIAEVLEGCPHVGELENAKEISDDVCGILIKPEAKDELATAIRVLVENHDYRKIMGRSARQRALDRYAWGHHVGEILNGMKRAHALDATVERPKIRLLFNALHSKSGGGLTYLNNILPLMARDRYIDLHLCIHEDQRDSLPDNIENITVHTLNFSQGFWQLQIREQIDVPRLARTIGADVTFSPANFGPLLAPNTVLLLRNALSVAYVERRPLKVAYWILVYLMTLISLLFSRRAISVSEYARSESSSGYISLFRDRFTVIPHGVSDIFSPPKKNAKRENFLLAVSDLYVQKNLKNLICALPLLKTDHPDITLKIAGNPVDQNYFVELKRTVAQENLDDTVEFLGEVSPETLVELYRCCGVFVFPSTVETFGNPLVEAMACGAPIASSNTAAMPEVVSEAAVFFNPYDVEGIAKTINGLLNDSDLRADLGRKATKRAKKFTWQKTAERTLAVIKEAEGS